MHYNTGTHLLKWFDNICVVIESSFLAVQCTNTNKRFDLAKTNKIKVDCPDMFPQYKRSTGGVDLTDVLIPCFRANTSQEKDGTSKSSSIVLI